jgi:hypothetical protein
MLREGTRLDRLAVLVYNGPGTDTAHCWLEALEPDYSNVPVIVVVNEPNVEEHYELMSQGAYDYFGFSEGTTVIEEAVRWAAQTDAVSARAAARRSENFTPDGPATNLLKGNCVPPPLVPPASCRATPPATWARARATGPRRCAMKRRPGALRRRERAVLAARPVPAGRPPAPQRLQRLRPTGRGRRIRWWSVAW